MLEVLPFVKDPDLSGSAAPALPQLLPPWLTAVRILKSAAVEGPKYKTQETDFDFDSKVKKGGISCSLSISMPSVGSKRKKKQTCVSLD